MDKLEAARRQLGTALSLFIEDRDPVSVHALAGNAREIIEVLCRETGQPVFVDHIQKTFPTMERKEIYRLANKYRNAFKHLDKRVDDGEELAGFSDAHNDHLIFIVWRDYVKVTRALPIEAQVFEVWYYALYREKLAPGIDFGPIDAAFPKLATLPRAIAKARLRATIETHRDDRDVVADVRTEDLPLVFGPTADGR